MREENASKYYAAQKSQFDWSCSKMTADGEVKQVGIRKTQPLNDLRNRKRYWKLKEEAED